MFDIKLQQVYRFTIGFTATLTTLAQFSLSKAENCYHVCLLFRTAKTKSYVDISSIGYVYVIVVFGIYCILKLTFEMEVLCSRFRDLVATKIHCFKSL